MRSLRAIQARPRRALSVALAAVLLATLIPFQAVTALGVTEGTTWYVDGAIGSDGNPGTSAEPFETVYAGVDAASDGDTVLVSPGTYWCDPLVIDGFNGLTVKSTGGAAVTRLVGDEESPVVVIIDSENVTLDGFTISGGSSEVGGGILVSAATAKVSDCVVSDNDALYGAGLVSYESTVTIEGTEFSDNFAYFAGAGIGAIASKLVVEDSEFVDNGGNPFEPGNTLFGAGMDMYYSDAVVRGTVFEGNMAVDGGGLLAWGCDLDVSDSVFTGNSASEEGLTETDTKASVSSLLAEDLGLSDRWGSADARTQDVVPFEEYEPVPGRGAGLGVYDGDYTVSGTEFTENEATQEGGGAFAGIGASLDVSDSLFESNLGLYGGGIAFSEWDAEAVLRGEAAQPSSWADLADARTAGDVTGLPELSGPTFALERSVFRDNMSLGAPAAYIDSPAGLSSVTNCLFEGNNGLYSGVVAAFSMLGWETDSTVGPAITELPVEVPVTMTMANNTFANNVAGTSASLYGDGGSWDVRNTIAWGNTRSEGGLIVGLEATDALGVAVPADAMILAEAQFTYCDLEYGYFDGMTASLAGAGNFSKDPKFAADYNLTSGSPCIDTGTKVGAPVDDIDGWIRPMDGDNDGVRAWDVGAYEYFDNLVRDVGMNRYATAVKACQQHFDSADTVIVATGEVFADGLSAAGLAGSYDAPILLSPHATMPALVKTEIKRLGATHAVVIGGENALSSAVIADLKAMGLKVERIGGVNRYSTAAMIAVKIAAREGNDFSGVGFVARGDTFPDALSVSPIAYAMKSPILLVKPTSMPQATVDVIEAVDFDEFMIAGGPDAVSSMAVGGLTADTTQIGGLDRYDTSAKVSDYAVAKGWAQMSYTGIATGENFPDALTGGAALGSENGVLLLTPYKILHSSPKFLMEKRAEEVRRVEVLGGTSAVSDAVWNSIAAILN